MFLIFHVQHMMFIPKVNNPVQKTKLYSKFDARLIELIKISRHKK